MKICVFGAGAIGAWLGAELSRSGQDVTLIARGPHLKAMQEHGVRLLIDGQKRVFSRMWSSCSSARASPRPTHPANQHSQPVMSPSERCACSSSV